MMGSMDWSSYYNGPAFWLSNSSLTDSIAYYGFTHYNDPGKFVSDTSLIPNGAMLTVWDELNMNSFGPFTNIDSSATPYNNSHMLTTLADPATFVPDSNDAYHGCPASDTYTPMSGPFPLFKPVWEYLIGLPGVSALQELAHNPREIVRIVTSWVEKQTTNLTPYYSTFIVMALQKRCSERCIEQAEMRCIE